MPCKAFLWIKCWRCFYSEPWKMQLVTSIPNFFFHFLLWYKATPCLKNWKIDPIGLLFFKWWACILSTWIYLKNIIIICKLQLLKCKKENLVLQNFFIIAKTLQSYQWSIKIYHRVTSAIEFIRLLNLKKLSSTCIICKILHFLINNDIICFLIIITTFGLYEKVLK